jgi:hypothetical protein
MDKPGGITLDTGPKPVGWRSSMLPVQAMIDENLKEVTPDA